MRRPRYDPAALSCGILHLGCGAFHRAHQAFATQRAIEAQGEEGLRWGIAAASMTRMTVPGQLQPQDGLYTLLERSAAGTRAEIIGTLREVIHAPTDPKPLPQRIADPQTRIVTLTITPPGYLLEPASGRLQKDHLDVLHDLRHPAHPRSAIGAIAYGLRKVRDAGTVPPVIISCDNVSDNGRTLRRAVANFAAMRDDTLASWIDANVCFPNTMVDRIVPAATSADREDAERLLGLYDAAPVSMEPYIQWVIEEFDGPRPLWEAAGAQFVRDVRPFELAKLRLLNGTHMLLAYLGALAGYKTIAETVADPLFAELAEAFMLREQGATLDMAPDRLRAYVADLMARLRNPAIRHDVSRIGRNGSAKFATRLMRPLRENLQEGRSGPCTILVAAAWIRWFTQHETKGPQVLLIDQKKDEMKRLCAAAGGDPMVLARSFLGLEEVFGPKLPNHEAVVEELARDLHDLATLPVREVVRDRLAELLAAG